MMVVPMPSNHMGPLRESGEISASPGGFDPARLVRDYGDVAGEVAACRESAALFDFSFLAGARVSGRDALEALAHLTSRRLDDLRPGGIRYGLCRGPDGCLRSDLTVWNEDGASFLVMSGHASDVAELAALVDSAGIEASVEVLADATVVHSVQGPDSLLVLDGLLDTARLASLPYFGCTRVDVAGLPCLVGRLGYTGERGFEIVHEAGQGARLWQELAGRIRPVGFAAADCLRIEAGFVLFANEFRLPVTAAEAGLEPFSGADPVPPRYRLVSFRAASNAPPILWRPSQSPTAPEPGTITATSACHSAIAGGVLGLGYVLTAEPSFDRGLEDPSGEFREVRTSPRPFYDPQKRRPRGSWS